QLAVQQLLKVLGGDGDLHVPVMVLVGLDGELAALGLYVEGPSGLPGQVDLDSGGVRHGAGVRPDEPGLDLAEVFLECHSVCSFPRVMLSCYHTPARNTRRLPPLGNKIPLGSARRVAKLCGSHPPAPSHALTVRRRIAFQHGRGRQLYSLIPKGVAAPQWGASSDRSQLPLRSALNGRHRRPAPEPAGETVSSLQAMTERAALIKGGLSKGG